MDEATPKIDRRYQIIKKLGYGMSGEVYLVKDHDGEKALKFLNQVQMNVSRDEALKNFKNEFSILKELNHPNIAQILDFGFDEETQKYYFSSELVDGTDLFSACRHQSVDVIEKIFIQVLRALNYLHSRGIYHFDIKPQNILVHLKDGVPETAKIIDFGLAALQKQGNKKVGTPSYIAPEVIVGGVMDGRTDLYSLGVAFYKCFVGENPFFHKDYKVIFDRQKNLIPKNPSEINHLVPKYLDTILQRMLKKKPIERYPQASMILRDIGFLSGKSIDIETDDTKLSYLPEKGALIAREKEWGIFTKIFDGVFESQHDKKIDLLIVRGEKGTGKTRIIEEIKYYSQLKNIPFIKLEDVKNLKLLPEQCVLSVDKKGFNDNRILSLLQDLQNGRCLIVWATELFGRYLSGYTTIELKNFDEKQLQQYMSAVTGLSLLSKKEAGFSEIDGQMVAENLVHEIYLRTEGNLFFITEYFKALFNKGMLFDSTGRWEITTFEDIHIDFDQVEIPHAIYRILLDKYIKLPNISKKILQFLSINREALSLNEFEILLGVNVQLDLNRLNGILYKQKEGSYYFKNYLMSIIVFENMVSTEKILCHDQFVKIFENKKNTRKQYLYHKGHGSDSDEARRALNEFGDIYLEEYKFSAAEKQFSLLLEKLDDEQEEERLEAFLKLGQALIGKRDFDKAHEKFKKALEIAKEDKFLEEKYFFKIFEKLISVSFKQNSLHETGQYLDLAEKYCFLTNEFFKKYSTPLYCQVIIQNHLGTIDLERGEYDHAIEVFLRSYKIWIEKLNAEEKKKVFNNYIVEAYGAKGEYDLAWKFCEKNIKILEQDYDARALSLNFYFLGDIFYKKARRDIAMKEKETFLEKSKFYLKKALDLVKKIGDQPLLYRVYNAFANTYYEMDKNEKALKYYERALRICERIGEHELGGSLAYNIANIYNKMNLKSDQESYLIRAILIFEKLPWLTSHSHRVLLWSYIFIADLYVEEGENRKIEAKKYINRAERLFIQYPYLKTEEYWLVVRQAMVDKLWGEEKAYQEKLKRAEQLKNDSYKKEDFQEFLSHNLSNVNLAEDRTGKELFEFKKAVFHVQNFEEILKQSVLFFNNMLSPKKIIYLSNLGDQKFKIRPLQRFNKDDQSLLHLDFVRDCQTKNLVNDFKEGNQDHKFVCVPIKLFGDNRGAFYLILGEDKNNSSKEHLTKFKNIFEAKFLELQTEVSTHFL